MISSDFCLKFLIIKNQLSCHCSLTQNFLNIKCMQQESDFMTQFGFLHSSVGSPPTISSYVEKNQEGIVAACSPILWLFSPVLNNSHQESHLLCSASRINIRQKYLDFENSFIQMESIISFLSLEYPCFFIIIMIFGLHTSLKDRRNILYPCLYCYHIHDCDGGRTHLDMHI